MSEQEFNMLFASNLNRFLRESGHTQADLAKYIGVSTASVSNWCNGIKLPRMDKVDKICSYFGITRTDLMRDKSTDPQPYYLNPETAAVAQRIFEDKDLRLLFDAARDARPEDLQLVHQMLVALKKKESPDYEDPA